MTRAEIGAYRAELDAGAKWWRWEWSWPCHVILREWEWADYGVTRTTDRAVRMFALTFFIRHTSTRAWVYYRRRFRTAALPQARVV